MSEPTIRAWRFYLGDMIAFAERALAYTDGLDQAAFVASPLHYDATIRNLELIGEAANHLPDTIRTANPDHPLRRVPAWRLIIATRNRLIHGYLGIDNDTLWSIIRDHLPVLLPQLRELRDRLA